MAGQRVYVGRSGGVLGGRSDDGVSWYISWGVVWQISGCVVADQRVCCGRYTLGVYVTQVRGGFATDQRVC